jgi:hypothetical protein
VIAVSFFMPETLIVVSEAHDILTLASRAKDRYRRTPADHIPRFAFLRGQWRANKAEGLACHHALQACKFTCKNFRFLCRTVRFFFLGGLLILGIALVR